MLFRLENPASVHFLLKYHLGNAWLTNDWEAMGDKNLDFEYSVSLEPEHLRPDYLLFSEVSLQSYHQWEMVLEIFWITFFNYLLLIQ